MSNYWKMLKRDRLAMVSVVFLFFILIFAFVGGTLVGQGASTPNLATKLISPFHLEGNWLQFLGTDSLGRNLLERSARAARTSLSVSIPAAFLAALLGSVAGVVAGYKGGILDGICMRVADMILSFPVLLLSVLFLYMFQPSLMNIVILLIVCRIPLYLRVARASTLEVRKRLFVDAARSLGASDLRICRQEIAPVIAPTIFTLMALDVGLLMLLESALSFLGVGIQPPEVSLGIMIADGRRYITSAWWLSLFPGLLIFLIALSCNIISNWLRIAMDPAQRWRLQLDRPQRARLQKTVSGS
jgi:peptide/nickel transport system permease protein